MGIEFDSIEKPIFLQLAEILEDNILDGILKPDEQIPSIAEISHYYKINPATGNKSVNLLCDEGLVYKKRGIGMFVAENAVSVIKNKRFGGFFRDYVVPLVEESEKLSIKKEELIKLISDFCDKKENE